ncbi:sensor histidine kinase [Pseudocolwellia sp. HL-MZ19]|uniref:sensor histidine kinase n=1 Tax=unclassified Pseudocolwellia TaxID=2848178 RepID=UPI003CF9C32F
MNIKSLILSTLLLFLITLEVLIALDYLAQEKQMRGKRIEIYQTIIELQSQIGYVGLIHNFKNYMLRPEQTNYRDRAIVNYKMASKQVESLEVMGDELIGNIRMPETRIMLLAYKERLDRLPGLMIENVSARELDNFVKFNDLPSRNEIELVFREFSQALDSKATNVLYSSLTSCLVILIGLIFTLVLMIRSLFKEQRGALTTSNQLNAELEENKVKIECSQIVLLNVMKDVENEKQAASILNKELVSKNNEMEQFIYTVSHDLKSPLVTISGFANKLHSELADTLTERQAHRLNRIIENVNNMEHLLSDLLELSKIVQQPIVIEDVDVGKIIQEQSLVLEDTIIESEATINLADNLHTIKANERLFSEIILNLLSNSLRYREPSRKLVIDISTSQTDKATIVHVKDNGTGIDAKYHALVFDIFERLSTHEGSGVGLTIVRTVMEKHKGKVSLKSELGKGCHFLLEFPNNEKDLF